MDFLEGEKSPAKSKPVVVQQKKKESTEKVVNGDSSKKSAKKKQQPKEHREVLKMTNNAQFEKDVRKLSPDDLVSMLDATKTHFPTNRSMWIKDVAAYLNHCLPYEVPDSVFEGKSSGQ